MNRWPGPLEPIARTLLLAQHAHAYTRSPIVVYTCHAGCESRPHHSTCNVPNFTSDVFSRNPAEFMTYATAGRHHYNFQTSDEITSPPFSLPLCLPCLDQYLRGGAVRNSVEEADAPGPPFLLLSLSRGRGRTSRSAGPSGATGVSSHLLHACSQQNGRMGPRAYSSAPKNLYAVVLWSTPNPVLP